MSPDPKKVGAALEVACPICGAPAGVVCPGASSSRFSHRRRKALAMLQAGRRLSGRLRHYYPAAS